MKSYTACLFVCTKIFVGSWYSLVGYLDFMCHYYTFFDAFFYVLHYFLNERFLQGFLFLFLTFATYMENWKQFIMYLLMSHNQ